MKKIILCLFILIATTSKAQQIATIDGIKYILDNENALIMQQPETLSGDIIIPETVVYNEKTYIVNNVGDHAFSGTKIKSIILPNSVSTLGYSCFDNCSNLTSVILSNQIKSLKGSCFSNCTSLVSITLPNNITEVGEHCFYRCTALKSITLPNNITELGQFCFGGCSSLESITLPNSITKLGSGCFENCFNLTSITLSENLNILESYCFSNCKSLKSVLLPNSIISIGDRCFYGCTSLTSIILPNSITELGNWCFRECSSLNSITLPNNITTLGEACFYECSSLNSITLSNSTISLGDFCFYRCTSLTSIILPKSITYVGGSCFSGCSYLMKISCQWNNPNNISTNQNAFTSIYPECILYIPIGTKDKYMSVEPWNTFKTIIEKDTNVTESEKCATPTINYENKKLIFNCTTEGAEYHYNIKTTDSASDAFSTNGTIELSAAYHISVYASANGYINSNLATATLYFIDAQLSTSGINATEQRGIIVNSNANNITISGLYDGEKVTLYNINGMCLSTAKAIAGCVSFNINNTYNILIAKIGNNCLKIKINN